RDAARGGVRVVEEALLLEVAHRVADSRRREPQLVPLGDSAAPRWFSGLHVGLDDGLEHLTLAVGKRRGHDANSFATNNLATSASSRNQPSGVHRRRSASVTTQPCCNHAERWTDGTMDRDSPSEVRSAKYACSSCS